MSHMPNNAINNQIKTKKPINPQPSLDSKHFLTDSALCSCCPPMSQRNKVSPAASSDTEKQDDNGWRLTEAYRDSIVYQIFGTGAHYKHNYVWSVLRGAKYIMQSRKEPNSPILKPYFLWYCALTKLMP